MSSTSAARSKAAPVLALFRQILRLHRDKLPPPMRAMGDTYVKDEFAKHLKGKTTEEQWRTFMHEWQRYHAMLAGNADILADPAAAAAEAVSAPAPGPRGSGEGSGGAGPAADLAAAAAAGPAATTTVSAAASGSCGELAEDVLELFTPEQRARLERLRVEAGRFGRGLLTPEGGEGAREGAVVGEAAATAKAS